MEEQISRVKWKRPRIQENLYPSGRPHFFPYPYVTDIMSAYSCPVAVLHRLLHGVTSDPTSPVEERLAVGSIYHEFIAHVKTAIAQGNPNLASPSVMQHDFSIYAGNRNMDSKTERACWQYLEEWTVNRQEELGKIEPRVSIYFEVHLSEPYVRFAHNEEGSTYPLRGKIDEINIQNRKIIERTIRGGNGGPPEVEAYQVWLLWKILDSIHKSKFPSELANIDFPNFSLVVETPSRDYLIEKMNPEFESKTHDAYAWIHDLTFDQRRERNAFMQTHCFPECGLRTTCFKRNEPFPSSKPTMHQEFRRMYRYLLWEQVWMDHLFEYYLLQLPISKLVERGLASTGTVSFTPEGKTQLSLPRPHLESMYAEAERGGRFVLLFGTPSIGHRIEAKIDERRGDKLLLNMTKIGSSISREVFVLSPESEISVFESRPWFLNRLLQNDLFRLERMGRRSEASAKTDSIVQLLESLFGTRVLRREGSGRRQDQSERKVSS